MDLDSGVTGTVQLWSCKEFLVLDWDGTSVGDSDYVTWMPMIMTVGTLEMPLVKVKLTLYV